MAERPELLGLATEIVSAHVSNNPIASDQIPGLIQQVFNALATVEQASAAPPKAEPAVPVKKSVLADHIVCLDCGKHFSMLRRHLRTDHQDDAAAVPPALGVTKLVSAGCARLCKDEIGTGKEDQIGAERSAPMKARREATRKRAPAGNPMRIAVIADIHGNLPALEAVLAEIQRRDVDRTINLGDCVSGPLWPREVCDLLMASGSLADPWQP